MAENGDNPAVYLFPVPMGNGAVADVLPARNVELLKTIRYFVVENIRSARRFLRAASRDIVIDDLHFTELSEHTPPSEVAEMLAPMAQGHSIGVISEAPPWLTRGPTSWPWPSAVASKWCRWWGRRAYCSR